MPAPPAKPDDNPEVAPTSAAAIRSIAMPADTNPHGDIFGGWLLCQMDLAGSTVATRRANGRVVTVAITAMTFHRPVLVGDEVSCYCDVKRIGNTSIAINIESWVRRGTGDTPIKVTEGLFTYVRVGADGRPQPIASHSDT
jgi:acyl-CoA thioesterase YciA